VACRIAQETILFSYRVSRLINDGAEILNWSIGRKKGKMSICGYAAKASAAFLCQQTGGQFCHGIGWNISPKRPTMLFKTPEGERISLVKKAAMYNIKHMGKTFKPQPLVAGKKHLFYCMGRCGMTRVFPKMRSGSAWRGN
jgi:hypothetical protein